MISPPTTGFRDETVWRPRQVGRPPETAWDDGGKEWLLKVAGGALVAALVVPFLVGLILFLAYQSMLSGELPPEKPSIESEMTRIFDAGGRQIGLLRQFDLSIPVQPEDIPPVLEQAVLAAEDRRFYSHDGVDDRAVLRALWADITGGGYVEGASTITQQYARLAYLSNEKTLRRKLREAALARRLEEELTKDEILYRYLSRTYFGSGAYGVGAAAQSYFRKPVKDLTLSEAALLAGLIRLPSVNEPRSNPSGAETVRLSVLDRMLQQRRITHDQHAEASAQPVFLIDGAYRPEGPATVVHPHQEQNATYPYYVDYVRRYLVAKYGDERVYRGGLQVHTALDPGMQAKADAAVSNTLKGTSPPLEMAMVSVDPRNGLVRAIVGGRDFARSQVNLALGHCATPQEPKDGEPFCIDGGGTGRQPGSAFKPFTLAKALEKGMSPDRVYRGPSTYTFPNCRGEGCTVHNVESSGYGSLTLRQATAYSVNTVFAQLINDVGIKETADLAHRMGITMVNADGNLPSGEPYGPSLTLGAAEVSPLDMAAAFGVFANRGQQMAPTPVVRIETTTGEVVEDNRNRRPRRVLSQDIADRMNAIMGDVITSGTGRGADIGRPNGTAGKTGTSEDYGDAWFIGYTPELSTAIWMGFADSRRPLTGVKGESRVYGGTFAAPTWKAYMTEVGKDLNLTDFAKAGPPPPAPPRSADDRVSPAPRAPATPGTSPTTQFPSAPRRPSPNPTPATTPTSRLYTTTTIYRPPATTPTTRSTPTTRVSPFVTNP